MTGDTIVYYRSRPSKPEASGLALRLQREAVREHLKQGGFTLAAEFVKREGEAGSERGPAFMAARHAALNTGRSMLFIIASRAAIGSGGAFQEPDQPAAGRSEPPAPDGMSWSVLWGELFTPSVPTLPEIVLPAGAPGPLCLYAECRPGQLGTLVHLGNAGPDALAEVVVKTHTVGLYQYLCSKPGKLRWAEGRRFERRWDAVAPGTGVLVTSLNLWVLDDVSRHRLACTGPAGRRRKAEACDVDLRSCLPLDTPWAAFRPVP